MPCRWNRREVIRAAAGASAAALAGCGPRPAGLDEVRLSDSLRLLSGAGGNIVACEQAEGVALIDSGASDEVPSLLRAVGGPSQQVRVLFNTHWHPRHTGGNDALGMRGVRIIAHENTRLWLGADFYVDWEDRRYRPRPPEALPTETFYDGGTLDFGSETIAYGHLPMAHTDGDIYVHFHRTNILVAGDVVSAGRYPVVDYVTGGWLGGLVAATARLLDISNDATLFVPGTGPVQTRAQLQAQHDMLAVLLGRMSELLAKGLSADEMLAQGVTREFDGQWGDPSMFVRHAHKSLWAQVFALTPRPV